MLKLHGFAVSNYYSKVKLALMEKGVAFEEVLVWPSQAEDFLSRSPLGKVPFLETEHGVLCESQVIADYIEAAYPEHPLLPHDPFAAAKLRELITFIEWHLEIVVRQLYGEAFFKAKVSDDTKERVQKTLKKNIAAFAKLAKFAPYIGGSEFTLADCAAAVHLPLISSTTRLIYGQDMLADLPVKEYGRLLNERETVRKVRADIKDNMVEMVARH